jgi:hypothetical protein
MFLFVAIYIYYLMDCLFIMLGITDKQLGNCTDLINEYKTWVSSNNFEFIVRQKSMELEKRHVV